MGFDSEERFLRTIGDAIAKDESGVSLTNIETAEKINIVCGALKDLQKGSGNKVVSKLHYPMNSTGVVDVNGKKIKIKDAPMFCDAMSMCSNFEIVPMADGTVELNCMFYGLTQKISD